MRNCFSNTLLVASLAALAGLAQDQAPTPQSESHRRLFYGFRVEAYPLRLFDIGNATASTTKPIADYSYTGSTSSQRRDSCSTLSP